jgi:hypothetical protein
MPGRSNVRLRDDYLFITCTPPPVAALWLYDVCPLRRDRNGDLWIFPECALTIMSCFLRPARRGAAAWIGEIMGARRRPEGAVGGIGPHAPQRREFDSRGASF